MRKIRAFNPTPGAVSSLDGVSIKIWDAVIAVESKTYIIPGAIITATKSGLTVACGDHTTLRITQLQMAGKKRMSAADFLNGMQVVDLAGKVFQ